MIFEKRDNLTSVKMAAVSADPNYRFRRAMEDTYTIIDRFGGQEGWGFFAVYDGHGGSQVAQSAQKELHKVFFKCIQNSFQDDDDNTLLNQVQINKEFQNENQMNSNDNKNSVNDNKNLNENKEIPEKKPIEKDNKKQNEAESDIDDSDSDSGESETEVETEVETDPEIEVNSVFTESFAKTIEEIDVSTLQINRVFAKCYSEFDGLIPKNNGLNTGATAVTCFIMKHRGKRMLFTANIGDSRAILVRENKPVMLTFDHKPTVKEEEERVSKAGGFISSNRILGLLAVSRSFGDFSMKEFVSHEPFTTEFELTEQDKILIIACDGIWDVITNDQAVELIKDLKDASQMSKTLLNHAIKSGSTDNITCMVVLL
ncbi:alphabet isoform e [Anaeramoeba ignava]|uniref:Alphabet isoform e n=1 Tax=Anaeramoeba ignava TaxID=1746090 RepID=A0A9Q0R8Q4_ANAIG|nr:alphabet isoform e [Anaeramoeba ignava]